jgi:hypothetical protein
VTFIALGAIQIESSVIPIALGSIETGSSVISIELRTIQIESGAIQISANQDVSVLNRVDVAAR